MHRSGARPGSWKWWETSSGAVLWRKRHKHKIESRPSSCGHAQRLQTLPQPSRRRVPDPAHADIGGRILEKKRQAERLAADAKAVELVIQMFDPEFNARAIAARRA
jgi:hypothetical protein